jgi:hypothetical protein
MASLDRQVELQVGMGLDRIGHEARVRQDGGVDAELGGEVNRLVPARPGGRLRKGVQRHQHPDALGVGIADAFGQALGVEVQAREVAGVGVVLEPQVDAVRAVVDGRLERRQAARGAEKLEECWFGHAI